jgi:TRAP-type C4-dicarboxylate transport system substrate-binding protein
MKNIRLAISFLCLILVFICSGSALAQKKPIIFKVEHDMAPNSLVDKLWQETADRLWKASNGELKLEIYPSISLSGGKIPTMMQNLILGSTDIGQLGGVFSTFVPEIGVYALPFLTTGIDEMHKLTWGNELSDKLYALAEKKGIRITSVQSRNLRQFANNKHTIRKPEDMVGLTFRAPEAIEIVETFRALGANPISMPFSDLPMAMTTGAVDGAERPTGNLSMEAWWDLGKYITISDYSGDCEMIGINVRKWNSLSPEHKNILQEVLDWAAEERYAREKQNAIDVVNLLREKGCEVTILTDEEKAAFAKKVKPVWDSFAKKHGQEWIDLALKVLNKKSPF